MENLFYQVRINMFEIGVIFDISKDLYYVKTKTGRYMSKARGVFRKQKFTPMVGDNVKIYNQAAFIAEGSVLSLGLRSTKIRSKGGEIYFIPNGTINQVINYSLTYNLAICEFPINIETTIEDLENEVQSILDSANNNDVYKTYLYKHDKLRLDAIDKIEDNIAYITIVGKAKAGKNSSIETMLRRDFYNVFKDRLKGKDEK